ncbi:Bug family tripartite tricarboxylate transporter substrate binding protein [Roseovarius sp. D22-M7]|uniref:Bug family tripartite tricarboxylate transporter substrate binding protein n=1 Tax=Roseovarius sp. D22-M7 TaxID=3127116 RepID=UPI0030100E41
MNIVKTVTLGIAALGITAPAAMAEWEPRKPVDFVIMAGTGGGADQIARFIQNVVQQKDMMNRPLIPNNRGGGSGAEALIWLNETNDPNHTILVTLNSFFATPIRQPELGIDISTFTPIALMAVDPFALWVNTKSEVDDFEEWIETVKAADGEYIVGGTGSGQEDSIVFAYLQNAYDIDLKYIPFSGGGEVASALAGEQIQATVNNPAEARGFYQSGDVKPLLVFSDEQMEEYPDVPTLKEKGEDFSYNNQRAVVGAPGMSDEAAKYYQDLFKEIFETEDWQTYMEREAMSPLWLTPEEQREYWQTQIKRHEELLASFE